MKTATLKNLTSILLLLSGGMFFLSSSFVATERDAKVPITDTLIVNDGPYVFYTGAGLEEKSIHNGVVESKSIDAESFPAKFRSPKSVYRKIDKVAAFSDIHGQYDLMIKILKNNKIIDDNLNWSFDAGHLVIVGDIFDRGNKVTEILWFVYNLEKQALEKGGMVHYLLGNHEYMVMQNDLRYIHKKYAMSATLLDKTYQSLFDNTTVLGRWLRSKNTVVQINDALFVHGGISAEFVMAGFNPAAVNSFMRNAIDKPKEKLNPADLEKYFGYYGPIWYRGYFEDNLTEGRIDSILTATNVKHVVVGHTSQERVEQLYNQKIFAVDSSIKLGAYGELLFFSNDSYLRGTMEGQTLPFD